MIQKTTEEIKMLVYDAKLDFESVLNKALNNYLPKIFQSCPITEELCLRKQCFECSIFKDKYKQKFKI